MTTTDQNTLADRLEELKAAFEAKDGFARLEGLDHFHRAFHEHFPAIISALRGRESEDSVEKRERIAAVILWGMEQQTDELVAGLKERNAPLWQRAMKAAAALEGEVDEIEVPRFSSKSEVLGWLCKLGNARKEPDTWLNTNHRSYLNVHVLAPVLAALSSTSQVIAEGWRTIDSAPKDAQIMVWCENRLHPVRVAWWSDRQYAQHANGWNFHGAGMIYPTHWMPLPPPPQDRAMIKAAGGGDDA